MKLRQKLRKLPSWVVQTLINQCLISYICFFTTNSVDDQLAETHLRILLSANFKPYIVNEKCNGWSLHYHPIKPVSFACLYISLKYFCALIAQKLLSVLKLRLWMKKIVTCFVWLAICFSFQTSVLFQKLTCKVMKSIFLIYYFYYLSSGFFFLL